MVMSANERTNITIDYSGVQGKDLPEVIMDLCHAQTANEFENARYAITCHSKELSTIIHYLTDLRLTTRIVDTADLEISDIQHDSALVYLSGLCRALTTAVICADEQALTAG